MNTLINETVVHSKVMPIAQLLNSYPALLFAGFKYTGCTYHTIGIANEWHSIRMSANGDISLYKRGDVILRAKSLELVLETLFSAVFHGTHYVYVGGLAICPRQKFGHFSTDNDFIELFNRLQRGRAELQYKSDKAFRWRLADGTELTIKQSSFEDTSQQQEENSMNWLDNNNTVDIFSLVAASELFEVKVKFNNSAQEYSYKSEVEYAEGDKVVVDTPSAGLQVVTVISCSKGLQGGNFPKYKWVVAKVDLARYIELVDNEATAIKRIEAAKRAEKVKRELEALNISHDEILAMLGLASKTDSQ